jgi:hypothetical protein
MAMHGPMHLFLLILASHAWNPLAFSVALVIPKLPGRNNQLQRPSSTGNIFMFRRILASGILISNPPSDDTAIAAPGYTEPEDILSVQVKPKILIHERDFFRQSARLNAWDSYVLCSVLCTSTSYNALQAFHLDDAHQEISLYVMVLLPLIRLAAGLSVICGLYSTMVFSISILYGYTALGMERDPQYDDFLKNTAGLRQKAFTAFSLALGFFSILVGLVLSEKMPLILHIPVGIVIIAALFVGFKDWKTLVDNANPIYSDD